MEPHLADNHHKRTNLTDRALRGLKPAKSGTRYEVIDAVQPSLSVRVTDKAQCRLCCARASLVASTLPAKH